MSTAAGSLRRLELPAAAVCGFGAEPFGFRHDLSRHEALSLEALARVCEAVPRPWLLNHDANREVITPVGTLVDDGRSIGDVVRGLEATCNWLVVRHAEHLSPYRDLLGEVVDQAAEIVDPGERSIGDRGATLFIASPRAVVPVHIDRHHNFLLQVKGTKKFTVGSFEDPAVQAREVERNFGPHPSGSHLLPERQHVFELGPGDGVYIPACAFHWASGGASTSAAFSCAFRTERTNQIELAYEFNAFLGRLGLPHRPPTGSRGDSVKASIVRLRRLRGSHGKIA